MMKLSRFTKPTLLLCVLALPFNNTTVFAVGSGGFENASFSAASLGQSNAVIAQADEAAAISYNPAGLVYLPGIQTQVNAAFISAFTHRKAPNDDSQWSSGTINMVPTGYVSINPGHYLRDRLSFGVGADSPFGLSNKWNSNQSHVHYAGWRNYLKMYAIKPVASIKLHEKFSIGGGPIYYRIFDFGGIQAYPNAAVFGAGTPDGQVRLNLSGNTWGWHFGALAKPHEKHHFGFYFRSPATVRTRGRVKVENSTASGNFETGGKAKLDLPLNFTFGYAFKPTNKLTVETDLGYTRWAAHKRLFIDAAPVSAADDAILSAIGKQDKDYSDSWALQLGTKYKLNAKSYISAGTMFIWAAVPKDHFIPAVPDSNSLAFSLGTGYQLTKHLQVDISYFNRFWLPRQIDNNISETLGTTIDGKYSTYAQELMMGVSYKFDNLFQRDKAEVEQPILALT